MEVDIPEVDIFVAGTSCVDFSSLNSKKKAGFTDLYRANARWKTLHKGGSAPLTTTDLDPVDWANCIEGLTRDRAAANTSTTTFAGAINYIKHRQPKIVIFENVETAPWETTREYVFPLCGYSICILKLDTKHYYLPQTRSRKYVVGFSHGFFGVIAAQALCDRVQSMMPELKHPYSSSVTDFLFPSGSHDLHRGRNEMELASLLAREREVDWDLSGGRHRDFRKKHELGHSRPWIRWKENGSSKAPDKMWKPWESRQTNRVSDLLDCAFLVAVKGKNPKHMAYDPRYKAQIIDCSQNLDRVNLGTAFGATGCLTPNAIPVLTLEARPITGSEALRLQGMPIENFNMSIESQAQLQDLAGNAMTTTVVGATLLAALASIARYSSDNQKDWLATLFPTGAYEDDEVKDRNSFETDVDPSIPFRDHPASHELNGLVLCAHSLPERTVSEILRLGNVARRRCVCYHNLAYSSMELYECKICGASLCKSCKGNPNHQLEKLRGSFDGLGCLSVARAEDQLRVFFPSILPMLSGRDVAVIDQISDSLLHSTYLKEDARILAGAVLSGLCATTYELKFIEITEAVRIEYVSKDNFILRVIIEKEKIIWYLHLDQWSATGQQLGGHKTDQAIARAIVGPEASSQFPTSWQLWIPRKVEFDLAFAVAQDSGISLASVSDLQSIPSDVQEHIQSLKGVDWTKHEECGFPESALWVSVQGQIKMFLFKDVNPIGSASKDEFVITSSCREMGRTTEPESRQVLLRIKCAHQIHHILAQTHLANGAAGHNSFQVTAFVSGWFLTSDEHSIRVPQFSYNLVQQMSEVFPASPPAWLRRRQADPNDVLLARHTERHAWKTLYSCHAEQYLLTMSLPVYGASPDAIRKVIMTLRDFDLSQPLDLAEFARQIGPSYFAVEREILNTLGGSRVLQLWENIKLSPNPCETCAPRLPTMFWKKPKGTGSRSLGPLVADCAKEDQKVYDASLNKKPLAFRIDYNVEPGIFSSEKKLEHVTYVDVRFVGRAHTLLAQASSQLPKHPRFHHKDALECNGAFALEFGVLEDPRPDLEAIQILQPKYYDVDPRQPRGFRSTAKLFSEQLASLEWMLSRENDESEITFTEREVSEIYVAHLRFRAFATASRQIVRRGRVVADNVGFGKTAVCLGLIARQWEDKERTCDHFRHGPETDKFDKLIPLTATLVIVPNQLTQQWKMEAERFLNDDFRVHVIQTFANLQKESYEDLQKARVIVCSNKVFQDPGYQDELRKFCDPQKLELTAAPKVYRAWYKQVRRMILPEILDEIRAVLDAETATDKAARLSELESAINECREKRGADGEFIPPSMNIDEKKWSPKILLEYFSFPRVIWDEFPYKNIEVTEFVAEVPAVSKWMLSGTPPLESLGDIANVAYLFNVHLARPLALVGGRQPRVCENPPIRPLSKLEEADLYQSRNSISLLKERHEQGLRFVRKFIRKNDRDTQKGIESVAKPLVLSLSTNARIAYLELQQCLRNSNFNANSVGADTRRRLMARVEWRENKLGTERAMEALSLRASSSFTDVRNNLRTGINASVAEVALKLYQNSVQDVENAEDRGRELFGKAVNLAWRLAHINLKNHSAKADNGESRQNGYYNSLKAVVENVLNVGIEQFSGWDGYESALRILIWDEAFRHRLGPVDRLSERPASDLPSASDTAAWAELIHVTWESMSFCPRPMDKPEPTKQGNLKSKESKEQWLDVFSEYLTKTPLHSRRWYLVNNLHDDGLGTVSGFLEEEWNSKVRWELHYRNANGHDTSNLVPIRGLRGPSTDSVMGAFDVEHLKRLDADRELDLSATSRQTVARVEAELLRRIAPRVRPLHKDWAQECTRRGLIAKSQESAAILKTRVCLAEEDKASEEQYINPDGCRIQVMDLPLAGKQRIRGGNMEVIFDHLMHTVDTLTKLLEHLAEVHGKKNLQQVIYSVLSGAWRCRLHPGDEACQSHYVSLACGHVHCSFSEGRVCGTRGCTQPTQKDTCITLASLTEQMRTINASDIGVEALVRDPDAYLRDNNEKGGPKALGVANLVKSMPRQDQVVVFVQNPEIMNDVYDALSQEKIGFVTPKELCDNESNALEMFKRGLSDAPATEESDDDEEFDGFQNSGAGAGLGSGKKSRRGRVPTGRKTVAAPVRVSKERKVLVQLINSEQAAGSNLHNANHVVFVSPLITRNQAEWRAQMEQALGRCVRFRQTKKVFVYHLVMDRTVEVDTLEWRMKQEVLVPAGRAFGDFTRLTVPAFLERFDQDEERGIGNEGRATSVLSRDDVQYLMGDDYISVTAARSTKTVQSAKAVGDEDDGGKTIDGDVEMSDA